MEFNREDRIKNGGSCESGYLRLRTNSDGKEYFTVEMSLTQLVKLLGDKVQSVCTKGSRRAWKFKV